MVSETADDSPFGPADEAPQAPEDEETPAAAAAAPSPADEEALASPATPESGQIGKSDTSDFFDGISTIQGQRTQRLIERKRSRRRRRLMLGGLLVGAILLVLPATRLLSSIDLPRIRLPKWLLATPGGARNTGGSQTSGKSGGAAGDRRFRGSDQAVNVLVIGISEPGGSASKEATASPTSQVESKSQSQGGSAKVTRAAKGVLVLRLDLGLKRVTGVQMPEKTYLLVPGAGFETVGRSYAGGPQRTLLAVQNLLGVGVDHFVELSAADFDRVTLDGRLEMIFQKPVGSSLREDKRLAYGSLVAGLSKAQIELIPLPVRAVVVGSDSYYEPKREGLAELVKLIWGVERGVRRSARVIVLNGSGVPAVAQKIADRLAHAGYTVVETKNASRFDYKKTEILVYKGDLETAKKIKQILGVGVIVNQAMPQDIADVAVVVGADYR